MSEHGTSGQAARNTIVDAGGARGSRVRALVAAGLALLGGACSGGGGGGGGALPATVPDFTLASFGAPTQVTHPSFPLVTERAMTFAKLGADESQTMRVLGATRMVMGVECRIVQHLAYEDGLLVEDARDWYAQDDAGNVWYMGEDVTNYEYDDDDNLVGTDKEGSWEAGLDVAGNGRTALPGFIMLASPMPGDRYHQEYYRGEAEDQGEVIALGVPLTLADGSSHAALQVRDTTRLEPGQEEDKYFAPGLGLVREETVGGADGAELVGVFLPGLASLPDVSAAVFSDPTNVDDGFLGFVPLTAQAFVLEGGDETEIILVEVLDTPRTVMGVDCLVVRDRVFVDGLLIEDTHDWYAQDDAGNVWYMGEEVDNYEYDDDGNLLGVDNEGAWEAGLDVAGVGSTALPGTLRNVDAQPGEAYHQEFYADEAEDMGYLVATDAEAQLADGTLYAGCLQVLDWNPLDPGGLEYKFFADGVGLVVEEPAGGGNGERLERKGAFDLSPAALPDFGAAVFSDPTTIDHPLAPWSVGTIYTYEAETEDGLETITVEVLSQTRVVAGVTCRVVQDVERLDGLVVEDTFDWYAQDDAGNVWYMGEDVTNYEYDDDDMLIGTDNEGSWEAGLDVAGVGSTAEPGYLLPATPLPGDSYRQEFYPDEAEDLGSVVSTTASVTLGDGSTYDDCLQTLEWNPLEPGNLEHKFYAPGVGLVLEVGLADGERVELVSVTN